MRSGVSPQLDNIGDVVITLAAGSGTRAYHLHAIFNGLQFRGTGLPEDAPEIAGTIYRAAGRVQPSAAIDAFNALDPNAEASRSR